MSVTLRPWAPEDVEVLFRIAAELETWEERTAGMPAPLTRERFEARLARTVGGDPAEAGVTFVVDVDGAAVGSAALFGLDWLARHAEAGISLLPEVRGRGIGTTAITQLVDFGFVRCNLRRVHLQAIASNTGAIRAYEKAGFAVEGRLREHAWVRGAYEDVVLMGLLRADHLPAD
jgi:RimJ/RimL family protein N-acetyltransferase